MKQGILFIISLFIGFPVSVYSQDNLFLEGDSIQVSDGFITFGDSAVADAVSVETKAFHPNPTRAVLYSAIFPGLGQIYNRKYWKLPIIYGGFLGCAYGISWNGTQYNGYKQAYKDFTTDREGTDSWKDYLPLNATPDSGFADRLKRRRDFFRRNRDLTIIVAVGIYAIAMIDAYVDAELFDFDISQDLSLHLEPVIFDKTVNNSRAFGLQCSITF